MNYTKNKKKVNTKSSSKSSSKTNNSSIDISNNIFLENKTYYYGFNEKPIEIKENCKTLFKLKKKGQSFRHGAYGSIGDVCKDKDCNYVVKAVSIKNEIYYRSFLRESLISTIMSKNNLCPKIHEIFVCLNTAYFIMDKWDGTLRELVINKLFKKEHLDIIMKLIQKMHDIGIIHCDLHTSNILYRIKKNKYEFCIVDFGLSLYFEDKKSIIPDNYIPNSRFPNIFYPKFDIYKFSSALDERSFTLFNTYYYINNYITPLDYIIIHKFYTSSEREINFNEYLKQKYKELNIIGNKNKTKEMYFNKTITSYANKYNNKSNKIKSNKSNKIKSNKSNKIKSNKSNKLKSNKIKSNKLKSNKIKSNKSNKIKSKNEGIKKYSNVNRNIKSSIKSNLNNNLNKLKSKNEGIKKYSNVNSNIKSSIKSNLTNN